VAIHGGPAGHPFLASRVGANDVHGAVPKAQLVLDFDWAVLVARNPTIVDAASMFADDRARAEEMNTCQIRYQ